MAPGDTGKARAQEASLYERDFYSWALQQAALMRAGRQAETDVLNLAEEIETLGRSEASAFWSSYRLILLHLLKQQCQTSKRSQSWRGTAARERNNAARNLNRNPGLEPRRPSLFAEAFEDARKEAAAETDLPIGQFPATCPWSLDQVEDDAFRPAYVPPMSRCMPRRPVAATPPPSRRTRLRTMPSARRRDRPGRPASRDRPGT